MAGPKIPPQSDIEIDTADEWAVSGKWVSVNSSNVSAIAYEVDIARLWVRFLDGSEYRYDQVGQTLAVAMYNCTSMGQYVWFLRRNGYKGVKDRRGQ